ncbi:carboxypeptidase C [Laetiporus sulphureus 93-53]|uniref:Carboxypeptidase n=1 Tax=Laetiporus sulphureus 93-53 TaxID=1314785 RepID=A0A165BG49_9APHY|nr:carboxypeptidase C [Laetiporus sulphureus 93-53]KZT00989.1 carboxypeptidase C [Laetiporus sulphureus 93-53]
MAVLRSLLPLVFLSLAFALPSPEQLPLGGDTSYAHIAGGLSGGAISELKHVAHDTVENAKTGVHKWLDVFGTSRVEQNGIVYELVSHPAFEHYQLRVTEPDLCDSTVQQYSGYLDIAEDKHLFFWFFEARINPSEAPLLLWLNGGPGCSSSTGLLFELGPCSVTEDGTNVTYNEYSWNTHANVIFLDQPVDVGFSYADQGTSVNTSPVAGKDVYAFLELFLGRFSKYADAPFHIAAESYGGTYAPNIASVIHAENKVLAHAQAQSNAVPGLLHINLASVMLGNGLTDPYVQMASVPDWACEGPYPVYDDSDGVECQALRSKVPTCQRLLKSCYEFNSRLTCVPALLYCNSQIMGPLVQLGYNPYDVRRKCDRTKDGDLCYRQMSWIDTWMNQPAVKKALGVDPSREFESCNMQVNQAFALQGDGAHNSAKLLPELIEDGVRLLVYAGNADMMCNFMGNERWVEALDTKFHDEFSAKKSVPWVTTDTGAIAGMVRSAGGGGSSAGNVTFVAVHEAGHMVPYDQPEAALDLVTRWLFDIPLSLNASASEVFLG